MDLKEDSKNESIEKLPDKGRPLIVKPVDWIVPSIKEFNKSTIKGLAYDLFAQRVTYSNFKSQHLKYIEAIQRQALKQHKNDVKIQYELSTVLMQNNPNIKKLKEAERLIEAALEDSTLLSEADQIAAQEIRRSIKQMLIPQPFRDTITCVNWGIYNRCPLVCKGCYNIFNEEILSLEVCKQIVDKLVEGGVKELIISGGDPLLWEEIVPFCEYVSLKGIDIGIDTVGYNLTARLANSLKGKVSYIGIPLDGLDQQTIETFRLGKKDLVKVLYQSIDILGSVGIPIRINTTVSKNNVHALPHIMEYIENHCSIKKSWAIYQWWDLRASPALFEKMAIPDSDFNVAIASLAVRAPQFPVGCRRVKDRALGTFFISSNGEVYTFGRSAIVSTIIIGDIRKQSVKEILKSPALKKDSTKFKKRTFFGT